MSSDEGKNELSVISTEILVTDADKYGTNISEMSNFFDVATFNDLGKLIETSNFEVVEKITISDIVEARDCEKIIQSIGKKKVVLEADLEKLPKKIKEMIKKGKNFIDESKQYKNRLRPVVVNADKDIQKEIVLKKVVKRSTNETALRNIANQQRLKQIDVKLNELIELSGYQIDLQRNDMAYTPFILARNEILKAQNENDKEKQREYFIEATKYLDKSIAGLYSSMDVTQKHLISKDKQMLKVPFLSVDKYISFQGQDLLTLTKLTGLQLHLYSVLGMKNEYEVLNLQYSNYLDNFFNKAIDSDSRTMALLIHDNCKYTKKNKDVWYDTYIKVKEQNLIEDKKENELLYLSVEEVKNEGRN